MTAPWPALVSIPFLLAACGSPEAPLAVAPRAAALHAQALVVDGHNDVPSLILDLGFDLGLDGGDPSKTSAVPFWMFPWLPAPEPGSLRTHTDIDRLALGGVDATFFSIFAHPRHCDGPGRCAARAFAMIDALAEQQGAHSDRLAYATSRADVERIAAEGKVAVLLGLEGGHAIEGELDTLRRFYERGIRYLTLTWSSSNALADASTDEARHGGLSALGVEVVREMNRMGMVIDVSHASDDTLRDVLETSRAPVIASHSSARALVDVPRNLDDDSLRGIARAGGVVMVNFGGLFIDPEKSPRWRLVGHVLRHLGDPPTPLDRLIDHIEHVARVAGARHVGLGSDFDGTVFLPDGVDDVAGFPRITAALLERGRSEREIRGILGGNVLRVLDEVAGAAAPGAVTRSVSAVVDDPFGRERDGAIQHEVSRE